VETAAYRIVQEALTNIARHADVREAQVEIWADDESLGIQVEDQGRGFDVAAVLESGMAHGLGGMKERIALLGGELTLDAKPGIGTRLFAELPLK
jgi:signal transduction histidine kinase